MGDKFPEIVASPLGIISSRQPPDDRGARPPEAFVQCRNAGRQAIAQADEAGAGHNRGIRA
jgi:hypothetical protein